MDAMHAASGYSPHMPVPIDTDMILGSKDPVAIDRVACEVTGIDTSSVDYFRVAEETGLGNYSMDMIDVAVSYTHLGKLFSNGAVGEVIKTGKVAFRLVKTLKNDVPLTGYVVGTPLFDSHGNLQQVVALSRDVYKRQTYD